MVGIYKIENLINGKVYIGQSKNIFARWRNHKAQPNSSTLIGRAIMKHGKENFSFSILEECSIEELDGKELQYMNIYNSFGEKGYNIRLPEGFYYNMPDSIKEIIRYLETSDLSDKDIASILNVSERKVRSINLGENWRESNRTYPIKNRMHEAKRCEICGEKTYNTRFCSQECYYKTIRKAVRPNKFELAAKICKVGFEAVGREYGVSGKAISKWCKDYSIPHLKKELIEWHRLNVPIA